MKTANLVGTLPRNWERALGYDGDARCVAFYWTPAGDDAMYDDGPWPPCGRQGRWASGDGQLFNPLVWWI
jgi:hypothetical protein